MSQSQYYVTHYFNAQNAGSFMAVSLIGLIVVLAIVLLTAKLQKHYKINIENPIEVELHKLNKHIKQKLSAGSKAFMKWYFQAPPNHLPFSLLCPRRKDPSGGLFLE